MSFYDLSRLHVMSAKGPTLCYDATRSNRKNEFKERESLSLKWSIKIISLIFDFQLTSRRTFTFATTNCVISLIDNKGPVIV